MNKATILPHLAVGGGLAVSAFVVLEPWWLLAPLGVVVGSLLPWISTRGTIESPQAAYTNAKPRRKDRQTLQVVGVLLLLVATYALWLLGGLRNEPPIPVWFLPFGGYLGGMVAGVAIYMITLARRIAAQ